MKISKLVATALIGAVAVTPVFADLSSARTAYDSAKTKYDDRVKASEVLFKALETLTKVGAEALKAYDPSGEKESDKTIKAAIASIEDIGKTGGAATDGITRTNLAEVTAGEVADGKIQVKVTFDSTTTNPNSIKINVNNTGEKEIKSSEKTNYADVFGIATDFVWDVAWATLNTAAGVVATGVDGLLTQAKTELGSKESAYADELVKDAGSTATVSDDMKAFTTDRTAIVQSLTNSVQAQEKAYKAAQVTEAKQKEAKQAIEKAVELVKSDTTGKNQATKDAIAAANKLLKDNKFTLTNANTAGNANVDGNTTPLDVSILASSNSNLTVALTSFVQTASNTALVAAQELLKGFNELTSGNALVGKAKEGLTTKEGEVTTKKSAYEEKAKVKTSIELPESIVNAATPEAAKTALDDLKTKVTDLKTVSTETKSKDDDTKKAWLTQAINDGLVFSATLTTSGSSETVTAENLKTAESGKLNDAIDAAVAIITDIVTDNTGKFFKDALDAVSAWNGAVEAKNSSLETLNDIRTGRLDATSDVLGGSQGAVSKDIQTRLGTQIGQDLADASSDDLRAAVASIDNSLSDISNEISKGVVLDSVKFAQQQSVATRLAVLANPYGADIALAKAINAVSNDSFADSGSAVNEVIKAYTDRFKNDNNLWGNVVGGKAKLKDAPNTDIYGVNIGYDKAFDNYIVGAFLGYANSSADSSTITHKSDIYTVGAYARAYFDNSELDTQFSLGGAKNKIQRYATVLTQNTNQSAKYNSFIANVGATYGYVFDLNEGLFLKPFAGLEYNYVKNNSFNESGDYAFKFSSVKSKNLYGKLGVELRKYVDNDNYFYVSPSIGYDLYKNSDALVANNTITKDVENKKKTHFGLNTGLDLSVTQNLSANINFAVKAASKEQFYNGNLGLRYKF